MKNLPKILFLLVSLVVSTGAQAKEVLALEDLALKYKKAKLVEMSVEKIVESELLGKKTSYVGRIFLAKGKFRWENTSPEKSLLVFDGKTIWSEQTPPPELGGPVIVAKGIVDKKNRSHVLISSLMGEGLKENFKVKTQTSDGQTIQMQLSPIKSGLSVQELFIKVNAKDKTMREISYKDDIGNSTAIKFSDIKFLKKLNTGLFNYMPPKGAQVTDL